MRYRHNKMHMFKQFCSCRLLINIKMPATSLHSNQSTLSGHYRHFVITFPN